MPRILPPLPLLSRLPTTVFTGGRRRRRRWDLRPRASTWRPQLKRRQRPCWLTQSVSRGLLKPLKLSLHPGPSWQVSGLVFFYHLLSRRRSLGSNNAKRAALLCCPPANPPSCPRRWPLPSRTARLAARSHCQARPVILRPTAASSGTAHRKSKRSHSSGQGSHRAGQTRIKSTLSDWWCDWLM